MPSLLPDLHQLLAHRYPFLLVDRITALDVGRRAEGIKRVTGNEWFFESAGVTNGMPAPLGMPNGLIVEALAQLSGAVLIGLSDSPTGAVGYFMGIDRVRYRGTVCPGDDLHLSIELMRFRRGVCRTRGEARVDGRLMVRAELTTILRPAP